jgi:hypothetical protein
LEPTPEENKIGYVLIGFCIALGLVILALIGGHVAGWF